jgi:hypothetical protein
MFLLLIVPMDGLKLQKQDDSVNYPYECLSALKDALAFSCQHKASSRIAADTTVQLGILYECNGANTALEGNNATVRKNCGAGRRSNA